MELVANNPIVVEELTPLTTLSQFVETIFVEDNSGLIELNKTVKISDEIHNITTQINYNLKTTRLKIKSCKLLKGKVMISDLAGDQTILKGDSNCELLCKNVNGIFAVEFDNFDNVKIERFNLYKQNFFKKIFYPNTESELMTKILELSIGKSWILLPEIFSDLINESEDFIRYDNYVKNFIYSIGRLGECIVYINSQETSHIYFGNYESVTIIINKNMEVVDVRSSQDPFQDSKKINISYEFIQNDQITRLEVL